MAGNESWDRRLACQRSRGGGGAARAGGHAPRAALDDVGGGAEAVVGRRLHGLGPGRKDLRNQHGVGERVAQCAAGVLVARIAED